ncbi:hypothetical protein QBC46DRAFT_348055 [Diplogelasinospora grovesii]|uniref:Uncharacterized protein n=1 Tax=Diplogelasinospora grovesii TaxID=303347 RepID=A0AAN6RYP4_9PEZI|nr:hypothetical protein QBC46DRAFT_348055 [Diplogelasinospora grovesii]
MAEDDNGNTTEELSLKPLWDLVFSRGDDRTTHPSGKSRSQAFFRTLVHDPTTSPDNWAPEDVEFEAKKHDDLVRDAWTFVYSTPDVEDSQQPHPKFAELCAILHDKFDTDIATIRLCLRQYSTSVELFLWKTGAVDHLMDGCREYGLVYLSRYLSGRTLSEMLEGFWSYAYADHDRP